VQKPLAVVDTTSARSVRVGIEELALRATLPLKIRPGTSGTMTSAASPSLMPKT
jgi:hypothetical protein